MIRLTIKKSSLLCGVFLAATSLSAQSRLVLNNDAFVVIDNGAFVVVDNSSIDAITQMGTGGRIVSESENDRLKWNIGTATGMYTIPFSTAAGVEFPFVMNITAAGTGTGNITFSTYNGATWDNNTYRPSDVTHMLDFATGSVNNSSHVIDRFWIVDPLLYTSKPSATFSFTYIDAEHSAAGNSIVEADLGAQRFNSTSGVWGDYLPAGAVNTITNNVSGVTVTPANFFRSWTLSEVSNPLAIDLVNYTVSCNTEKVNIKWTVAYEQDILAYLVLGSNDGLNFVELESVSPINSIGLVTYEHEVEAGYAYYSLRTREINGEEFSHFTSAVDCNTAISDAIVFVDATGQVRLNTSLQKEDGIKLHLFDAAGKRISSLQWYGPEGKSVSSLTCPKVEGGIYFMQVVSERNNIQKVFKLMLN